MVWSSCNSSSDTQVDTLEIYSVKTDGSNYAADTLAFYETTHREDNKIMKIEYYHGNGYLKGVEKYAYKAGDTLPYESKYYAPDGKLLSYYKLSYDNKGNKVMSAAYDANNDELLRRETFDYDEHNEISVKRIKNASDETQRIYQFGRDDKGNALTMTVSAKDGALIAEEVYHITLKDDDGRWIEKFGIVSGEPKTFHIRK